MPRRKVTHCGTGPESCTGQAGWADLIKFTVIRYMRVPCQVRRMSCRSNFLKVDKSGGHQDSYPRRWAVGPSGQVSQVLCDTAPHTQLMVFL